MPARQGDVERDTRAFVKSLGTLSPRDAALASAAIRCAKLLDAGDISGSAAASVSRELRVALQSLEPGRANVPAPAPETVEARKDSVEQAADELRARRERQQGRRPA